MKNEKFQSRSGCLDYGNSYEFLMAAYYGLTLSLNETVSDFKMSTNNSDMGNFDDVVLEIKYSDGDERLYALQLKHRGFKEDNINLQSFDAEKGGKFGLKKYAEGFKETEIKCKNSSSYNIPFEKFHFILYTNQVLPKFHTYDKHHKKVDADELRLKSKVIIYKHDKCVANGLIDLSESDGNVIFKFRNNEGTMFDEKFFEQFLLYTKQKDAQDIECRISKLICTLFPNYDTTIVTNYINFFKFWWRGDFGKYKLSKRDIMLKISEYVLTPYIPEVNIRKLTDLGEKLNLLKDSFENFDITVVKESENLAIQEVIWRIILTDCFSLKEVALPMWSQPCPGLESSFFPEDTKIPISAQGENFIEPSLRKIYIILWHMDKLPLFIKVNDNSRKAIYAAIKLCENHEKKKQFIVIDTDFTPDEFSEELRIFQNLSDLDNHDIYDGICKNASVSLQGRPSVTLAQLVEVDSRFCKIISVKEIIEILIKTKYVIGNHFQNNLLKHHITRFIPKVLLSATLVEKNEKDILVINLQECSNFYIKNHNVDINKYLLMTQNASLSQFTEKTVISVADSCSREQFQEVCHLNPNKNCHHIRVLDKNTLEWIETQGDVTRLKPHLLSEQDLDDRNFIQDWTILQYFKNRINVLCAGPGMGKSILLNFLKNKCPTDFWTILINLNDHITFFKQRHDLSEIFTYFIETEAKSHFVKNCANVFKSRKKILFLWDSFDELPSACVDSVTALMKTLADQGYWQWIAARSHSKEFLETTFGLFAVTVTQFTEKDQLEYIYNHLTEKYCDETDVRAMGLKLNQSMTSSLSCGYFDYSGVPLQIYMVMEIFLKNPEKYLDEIKIITLTDIYNEFIDGKFRNLYQRAHANETNYLMQKIQKKYKSNQLLHYQTAALKASFDEKTFSSLELDCHQFLQKIVNDRDSLGLILGLNDEGKPVFSHKTYEEYLMASWLVNNYQKFPQLMKIIFNGDYQNIRLMFDMLLAKDSPIHVAVLYRNIEILEKYQNDIPKAKDKGGRTPLHVACSWGQTHPLVQILVNEPSRTVISEIGFTKNASDNTEIVQFLLSHNCNPFDKDNIFQWDVITYCDQTLSLACLELLLSFKYEINLHELANFCESTTVIYYSIKFNYQNLFYRLKHYPYIEILEEGETKTLLQFSVKMDRSDFVATLLSFPHYQEVINKPYKDLGGILFTAAGTGNVEMFKLLLEKGAKLDSNQTSPLVTAVALGYEDICEKLLSECRMDPNQCNADGNSVLQVAALRNHTSIMKLLLQYGAKVNYVNYLDHTALDLCIDRRNVEGVQLLVNHGADVNRQGKTLYGYTPLHNACELENEHIVKFLLESGADATIKSNRLYTPLHVALINKQEHIAKIIIEAAPCVINEYSEEKSTAMVLAALEDNYNLIELLAKLGADLDSVQNKDSPLRIATLRKFEKSVEMLIKYGASVNRPDEHGFTPLFYAAAIDNENILKLFLNCSTINVNAKSTWLVTALHFAAQNSKSTASEELIKHGADINSRDIKNKTPLHYAIAAKDERVVKCLLKHKADLSDAFGFVSFACTQDAPDCLLNLLNAGIDVNIRDGQGRSALHIASLTSFYCVKVLILRGAGVNAYDEFGLSPLCYAIFMGKIDIVKELIKSGGDITMGFNSSSALHISAGLGDVTTLILLISIGCDVNAKDENGRTALHCAVEKFPGPFVSEMLNILRVCQIQLQLQRDYQSCAGELLAKGADATMRNNFRWSPVTSAAASNNVDLVKLFFDMFYKKGNEYEEWQMSLFVASAKNSVEVVHFLNNKHLIQLNCKENESGKTALHYAVVGDAYDTTVYLIDNGADVNCTTVEGYTPLCLSAFLGNVKLAKLLVQKEAKVNIPNTHGNTALFVAAAGGLLDIVVLLYENGADINVIDDDGDTPLHDAAARGHLEVVQYLASKKAIVNHRNKNGKVPLDLAKENKNFGIVEMLSLLSVEG